MILSVSRRTDIPAFYWDWFLEGLEKGEILVPNPYNDSMWRKVVFDKKDIDIIVFWSKNPKKILRDLDKLKGIPFYLHCTLTSYDTDIEANVPKKSQTLRVLEKLSKKIGKERIIWRYDPIIINEKYSMEYHLKYFELLCKKFKYISNKVVISFLEEYEKIKGSFRYRIPAYEEKMGLVKEFKRISSKYGLKLSGCCQKEDYSEYGVGGNACIDRKLIENIIGEKLETRKEPYRREKCNCIESIDIGWYSSCNHGCIYCYANNGRLRGIQKVEDGDTVKEIKAKSNIKRQKTLF